MPLETTFHGANGNSNGEVCTSTEAPTIDIHVESDDQDRPQSVIHQATSTLGRDVAEIINKSDSHLLNLPDEILLLIIKNLYEGSDKPSLFAFFVLRQVSQRFRGLMRDKMFMAHVFSDSGCCEWCSGEFRGKWTRLKPVRVDLHCFETKIRKAHIDIRGLGALIRSERICKTCRPEFESRRRLGVSPDCKFAARTGQDWMYCSACDVWHPTLCFSIEEVLKQSDRVCIARKGYIRICAHEVLTWDEMRAGLCGIKDVRKTFSKTCNNPSHNFHHKDHQTLPTASAESTRDYYYLTLSAGMHTKSYDESHRQDDRRNNYIEYRNHVSPLGMMQMVREFECKSPREHTEKMAGRTAHIWCEGCPADYECRRIYHRRTIMPRDTLYDLPGHTWYHAISPESYSYAGRCGVPETCSDPSCRNYYSSGLCSWHTDYANRNLDGDYPTDFDKAICLWRKKRKEDSVI